LLQKSSTDASRRPIPLMAIVLLALAVHGPLLLLQLPANSYDANTHIFFAAHYAKSWFNPWNENWFGGFSQTTYPPLTHQWIALFSHLMSLTMAYMVVQLIVVLLLVVGVYRYSKLWVNEQSASYAAIASVFLGSLALLMYQSGQLPTTTAAALTLNALPYFYNWNRLGRFSDFVKGLILSLAAAAAHHVTFLFGGILFAAPVIWLSFIDRHDEEANASIGGVTLRTLFFAVCNALGSLIVLLPYFIGLLHNRIDQMPIPHPSRDNYILVGHSGANFWLIPMGALILAVPYILVKGAANHRLRPLLFGWYVTTLLGLGGTTPLGRWVLGRAFYILTFERFTFWATLMAIPFVGLLADSLIQRYSRKAIVALWVAAVATCGISVGWINFSPINSEVFDVQPMVNFLNRDDHSKFRYITLGFGNEFALLSARVQASSIDGDYNSARLLPEMTAYGAAQLYSSKYYGAPGMEALRSVLKHADQYGLRYIFVKDRYYEPLLAFAGWRQTETYDDGIVTLWTKDDVPPAHKLDFGGWIPPRWQCILWGILPVGTSLLSVLVLLMLPDRRRAEATLKFPAAASAEVALREAK
jgi:hypothetical protein